MTALQISIAFSLTIWTALNPSFVSAAIETTPSFTWTKLANVPKPRGLSLDDVGDVLVVSSSTSKILALFSNYVNVTDGGQEVQREEQELVVIVDGTKFGLNHGIAYLDPFLYASSATTVYRWAYASGTRSLVTSAPEIVIHSMPSGGGSHTTRTLVFDDKKRLYVNIGSLMDVDLDQVPDRAMVRRFAIDLERLPNGGINAEKGEIIASGLRNSVGLGLDLSSTLWGVENGADNLFRADLGGDIHNGNPGEEVNKLEEGLENNFYGYPFCFSSYKLLDFPLGTQFAWPTFLNDSLHTDEWCRVPSNNRPPRLTLTAHAAPLDIQFYDGRGCDRAEGAFPCSMIGDAFVALHGSWNAAPPAGYRVIRLAFDKVQKEFTGESFDIIFESDLSQCNSQTETVCFRPVNLRFENDGHLIISSDNRGEIFRVSYAGN